MKRFRIIIVLLFSCLLYLPLSAQVDSTRLESLRRMLEEYYASMDGESFETKNAECDYIIQTCTDSLLRQEVTLHIYDHYRNSKLMGDEAVAIHVYDEWLADRKVRMRSEIDFINAGVFATFNRHTLLGCEAPRLTLGSIDGGFEELPARGRVSVLFFYSSSCAKCKLETVLLRSFLMSQERADLDLYAVYLGSDEEQWRSYVASQFNMDVPGLRIHHLWDPDASTEMGELYGLFQTPRMYLTDPESVIIGRGLDTEALKKMMGYAGMLQELYDRCPVGEVLPDITVPGKLHTFLCSLKYVDQRLSRFKGMPGYVLFHTEGCPNCEAERAQIARMTRLGTRILEVNVDQLWASDPELAARLFDAFDLTTLPYIVELDRKGRVKRKKVSFVNN